MAKEDTKDRDFTTHASSNNLGTNESTVKVKTLEMCFDEWIDREMSNILDTVEDRIQNAILTATDNIVAPKNELAIRLINAPSGTGSDYCYSKFVSWGHVGLTASFENASGNNNVLHVSNVNDEI